METMTPEQRRARILELEAELAQLRAEMKDETPLDRAQLASNWWIALRVGPIITLDEFSRLLDDCRELKQKSPAAACRTFRDRLELSMQEAAKYIRLL
ncbi:hypothetical protein [Burkholderia ubonensis]|uniref:hypothetical protein n=1 Tax=Burkholderia ubonensis TaxID=101571 RepID=UPI00076D9C56|nr:hypothetical protein [Burkholderia ubonensis]KVP39788.1 hypothetical protein WJ87_06285 [Burkholderia ubonensis]